MRVIDKTKALVSDIDSRKEFWSEERNNSGVNKQESNELWYERKLNLSKLVNKRIDCKKCSIS